MGHQMLKVCSESALLREVLRYAGGMCAAQTLLNPSALLLRPFGLFVSFHGQVEQAQGG